MKQLEGFLPAVRMQIQGYIAGDVENRLTPKGTKVSSLSIPVASNGTKQWYDVTVWGHLPENVQKGKRVMVVTERVNSVGRYPKFPELALKTDSESFKEWCKVNRPNTSIKVISDEIYLVNKNELTPVKIES